MDPLTSAVGTNLGPLVSQLWTSWGQVLCEKDRLSGSRFVLEELENVVRKHLKQSVLLASKLERELDTLCSTLSELEHDCGENVISKFAAIPESDLPLFEKVTQLGDGISSVRKNDRDQRERTKKLALQLQILQQELESKPFYFSDVPEARSNPQKRVEWLNFEIEECRKLKASRTEESKTICTEIKQIWNSIGETSAPNELSRKIENGQELPIDGDTMAALRDLKESLKQRLRAAAAELEVSLIKLCLMWERLRVRPDQRPGWWNQVAHDDGNSRVVYREGQAKALFSEPFRAQVNMEIEKLADEAASRVDILISKHHRELNSIWDRLQTPKSMRLKELPILETREYSLANLKAFEQKLLEKQSELQIKLGIIEELEKRQEFLDAVAQFENVASDPERFKSSKSNRFLEEQKFRINAAEKIRAMDLLVERKIRAWEEEHNQVFVYQGVCFLAEFYTQQKSMGIMELRSHPTALCRSNTSGETLPSATRGKRSPAPPLHRGAFSKVVETPRSTHLRTLSKNSSMVANGSHKKHTNAC